MPKCNVVKNMGKNAELDYNKFFGEISGFCRYLESIDSDHSSLNFDQVTSKYNSYTECLDTIYKEWFPKSVTYTDNHIAGQIFSREVKRKALKEWIRYELYALIESAKRVLSNVSNAQKQKLPNHLFDELSFLKEISDETIGFIKYGHLLLYNNELEYAWDKRNIVNSAEIFSASQELSRNRIDKRSIGHFAIMPTTIFLLRQAIEIRLKNALGIDIITNKNGKLIRITGEKLLPLIKDGKTTGNIEFPIEISVVEKIHKWTNHYIHGGFIPYTWEIEWAYHLLNPLFAWGQHGEIHNRFGSIKIKRKYYKQIDLKIKELLKNERQSSQNQRDCVKYIEDYFLRLFRSNRNQQDNDIIVHKLHSPEAFIID